MNLILMSAPFWGSMACLVAVAAFNTWLSRINQFFYFSRTVSAEFPLTPQAKKIAADYVRGVWLGCIASAIATALALNVTRLSLYVCFALGLLVECLCSTLSFARAHRLTGLTVAADADNAQDAAAAPAGSVASVSVSLLEPGGFTRGTAVQMVLVPLCATLAWIVPMGMMRMGFSAFADEVDKHGAAFLSGLSVGLLSGSVALCLQLKYFSRHRSRLARFTMRSCVLLAWFGAAAMIIGTVSVPLGWTITLVQRRAILGVILGVALLRMLYAWVQSRQFTPPPVERNGDEHWRWGLFYYNSADPALFIQHRARPGYTVNFANFLSWPLTVAVLADFVFLICIHLYR
jgi:hypothetical protein